MLTSSKVDQNIEKLLGEVQKSLAGDSFIKLILSNYKGDDRTLQKITVRPIETKKGRRLMFQSRRDTRDVVKNFDPVEAPDEIRRQLLSGFRNAHLFTSAGDFQLEVGKRNSRLTAGRPQARKMPPRKHDREKHTLIDRNAYYLKMLGITDDKGDVKPSQQSKWKQINKFVEILAGLIEALPLKAKAELKAADMGSGKGYLTFAAYDHLQRSAGERSWGSVKMIGVEQRQELVDTCNDIARAGGLDGLKFIKGSIADLDAGGLDILIALHACDTATDDALYKGVAANASIIMAAPCCHKELRKQIVPPEALAGVLKHGVMRERTAETLTDGIRSLLLEEQGYSTKVFEFVPTEHTPKNNMLTAVRTASHRLNLKAGEQADEAMRAFGIGHQRLAELLKTRAEREEDAL